MPERKFYFRAWWKWLLALFLIVFFPLLLLFFAATIAMFQFQLKGGPDAPGTRIASLAFLLPFLFCRFLGVLVAVYRNPHVILSAKGIRGQMVQPGGRYGGKFFFRRGFISYPDIGDVRSGTLFGVGYTYFHSASEKKRAIVVFNSTRNIQECFAIINKKRQKL